MATETKIVTLYQGIDSDTQQAIAPRTKTSAVSDNDGKGLDAVISELKGSIDDLKGSEATGISAELTGVLKTYFTNIQTFLTQVAYTTQNHIGNTLIQNAQNVVEVLTNGNPTEPDEPEVTYYSVTNNLSNASTSNTVSSVKSGSSYSARITANDGYTLNGATVKIMMASADVTSSVYSNGVITIPSVYGNVSISVMAVVEEPDTPEEPDSPTDTTYTVTRNLTGCTSSGIVSEIAEGSTLNETLTVNDGYTLPTKVQGGSISVTMGGTDITSNVYNYSTGNINISSVTGNIVITVVCIKEAVLPVNGLDDYFDLRNAEQQTLGNYKSYKATTGNGAIFGGANDNIITDDKGLLYARYVYSTEGTASWKDYSVPFTFASLTYGIGYGGASPYAPNNYQKMLNGAWNLCPVYKNSSGSTTQLDLTPQNHLPAGYHTFFITVDESNIMNFYLDNKLIQSYNGADYDDFVSWIGFQNLACLQYRVDYATAFATWNRALTEEELSEVERYLRTLEVA